MPKLKDIESRIREYSRKTDAGCWEWVAAKMPNGYGKCSFRGKVWLVHRASYTHFVGEIPEGLTIDHLCRNRACCNPAHLEPVPIRENTMRGEALSAKNHKKTHCKRGHALDGYNLRMASGSRQCRVCDAFRSYRHAGGGLSFHEWEPSYTPHKVGRHASH